MIMIDLHTHSAVSDGTDSIPDLVRAAHAAGIDVLSVTDHDTMDGVDEAKACGAVVGMEVLRGMEMSTHIQTGDRQDPIHLLGYGCDPGDPDLVRLLATVRESRKGRVPRMLEILHTMGMDIDLADVQAQASRASSLGRPHVADAMVAKGYVASREEAFRDYLYDHGPVYVVRYTPTLSEAVDLINRAHGIAVIAHPWGRVDDTVLTPGMIADLARDHGLAGIEADHVEHSEEQRRVLHELAHDLGLIATGSSDYHGTGKTRNPLGVFTTPRDVYDTMCAMITERGGQL